MAVSAMTCEMLSASFELLKKLCASNRKQLFDVFAPSVGNPCLSHASGPAVVEEGFLTTRNVRCNTSTPLSSADLDSSGIKMGLQQLKCQ